MIKFSLVFIIILISMGYFPGNSTAEDESVGAIFLNEGVGSRANAMGEAFVAIPGDTNMVFWNPGGLVINKSIEMLFTHTEFIQGFRSDYMAFSMPITTNQVIGVNTFLSYVNDLEKTTSLDDVPTSYGAYDFYFTGVWSYQLVENQSIGVGWKGIYQVIDDYSALSTAFDFGYLYNDFLIKKLTIGASIKNIGLPIKFIETAYQLPMTLEAGVAYRLFENKLLIAFDIQKTYQQELLFKFGAEYKVEDIIYLRMGYKYAQFGNDLGGITGLSAGLGVELADYKLDYAYTPYGDLGDIHRLSVTFPFGQSIADEEKIIKRLEKSLKAKQDKIIFNYIKNANQNMLDKDFKQAIANYEKALTLDPDLDKIVSKLASAKKLYKQSIINEHTQAGKKAYLEKEYVTALIEFTKVIEVNPKSNFAKTWLLKINKELEKPDDSLKDNEIITEYFKKGIQYLNDRNYQDAIYTWKRILKINPNHQQVIKYLSRTKEKLREEVSSLLNQAQKLWESDDKPEAVKLWRKVLILDNQNQVVLETLATHKNELSILAESLYKKGVQNYVTNKLVEAIANWKYVLMLEPDNAKALKNLERAEQKVKELESIQEK